MGCQAHHGITVSWLEEVVEVEVGEGNSCHENSPADCQTLGPGSSRSHGRLQTSRHKQGILELVCCP